MFLLAVGLETTATFLTNCCYALAFHQDVQDKLHKEISKIAQWDESKKNLNFDYNLLTACGYLDAVVSETLRCLPPAILTDSISSQDYYIEKYNIHIPKKTKILLGLYAAMNDPEYWHDPNKFNPERFNRENRGKVVPGSYCPFGLGPRHCLAMRFSLTESKMALAKLPMRFHFKAAPGTEYPPTAKGSLGLNQINKPHVLIAVR